MTEYPVADEVEPRGSAIPQLASRGCVKCNPKASHSQVVAQRADITRRAEPTVCSRARLAAARRRHGHRLVGDQASAGACRPSSILGAVAELKEITRATATGVSIGAGVVAVRCVARHSSAPSGAARTGRCDSPRCPCVTQTSSAETSPTARPSAIPCSYIDCARRGARAARRATDASGAARPVLSRLSANGSATGRTHCRGDRAAGAPRATYRELQSLQALRSGHLSRLRWVRHHLDGSRVTAARLRLWWKDRVPARARKSRGRRC